MTSTSELSDENDYNNDSDDSESVVCPPQSQNREGGGIGLPIIFITLIISFDNYNLDQGGRCVGGGWYK